jgi:uncharacterized protein with von Willebrand factor type A (vWA) domain
MKENKLQQRILEAQTELRSALELAVIEQTNKLIRFEKAYKALLAKFPEITVSSDVTGGGPKARISDLNKGEIVHKLIGKHTDTPSYGK